MVKTASIYQLKRLALEEITAYGLRVLVMWQWPRGISHKDIDLWIPSAAPLPEVLHAYRAGEMTWSAFAIAYWVCQFLATQCTVHDYRTQTRQAKQECYPQRALDVLRQLEQEYGTVTLLCWERTPQCHRFLLQHMVTDPSVETEVRRVCQTLGMRLPPSGKEC